MKLENRQDARSSAILPDPPSNFSVESSLSNELLKLNFKDRAELDEEIHGVRCGASVETPELVERSLSEFDSELNRRKEEDTSNNLLRNVIRISTLDEAASKSAKSKCYLNDPDIRLRFLRCELFVVEKAIERFIIFLEFTAELYGDFVADRPICLSDFISTEETALQNSRVQYLPYRDRSGRRVLASVGTCNFDLDADLRYKILMYLHWVVSEDVETQRKGVVLIAWIFDESEEKSWQDKIRPAMKSSLRPFHNKHYDALPVRLASYQQYYLQDTLFFRSMASLYVFHMSKRQRKLYRIFFGDETELLYKLSGFGVPTDLLPKSCTGKIKLANHTSWINFQRAKLFHEQNSNGEEIVECPRSEDVVFKKGPGYRNNPGNVYFRGLIEALGDEHQNADKAEKFQITLRIVKGIEEINGRFLEWSKPKKMWLVNKDRNRIRSKVASTIKQYNRQRGQSQQLKGAIEAAGDIAPDDGNTKRENSAEYRYDGKRRKILDLCDCRCDRENNNFDDDACFGRSFFPTCD